MTKYSKKIIPTILFLLIPFLYSACQSQSSYDGFSTGNITESTILDDMITIDGTVFQYADTSYDMTERDALINAILDYVVVGDSIIVECHTGPKNEVYSVFNTKTMTFEHDMIGTNLIWHDDVKNSVYSFENTILGYDGTIIGSFDLNESAFVTDLRFLNHYSQIEVTIIDDTEKCTILTFDL